MGFQLAAVARSPPAELVHVYVTWPKTAVVAKMLHKMRRSLRILSLVFISCKM